MNQLSVVGKTSEGKEVINGEDIFKLSDEMGFPLCMSIDMASQKGAVIDWIGFIELAQKSGWTIERIWNSIKFGIEDSSMDLSLKSEVKNRCQVYLFEKLKSLDL